MSTIGYINVSLETFGGFLSLIFILCLRITHIKKEKLERLYIQLLTCNTILLFCDAAAWLFKGRMDTVSFIAVRIANFFVFTLGYVMLALFTNYMISFLSTKNIQIPKIMTYFMWGLMYLAIGAVVLNLFNHMYYFIDEYNIYRRQEWFWLSQAFGVAGMILNSILLIRYRTAMQKKELFVCSIYISLPLTAMLLQMLFYGIAVLYLATTICMLCIYIGVQMEFSQEVVQKELELEKNRIALLMSQIQPHFLNNCLLGIKQLCDTEPVKASVALEHFAYYLRGNFYYITDPKPILFEKELEHLKDYLYLEKMRFEERITIKWDIRFTKFLIPPLTLQPLAENAVRHGITKNDGNGILTIRSYQKQQCVIVSIEDNGVGFDIHSKKDDSRPHVGIENVRKRLETQCGGRLKVESICNKGTLVTITLPQ